MGTTTSPDGLYKPAVSEPGGTWAPLVSGTMDIIQTRLNQLPQVAEFLWDHTGAGSTSTWNIRARGAADSKSLIRMMPQGVGEDATTGDRTELTWMFDDIDNANRGWVDLKVRERPSDNVRFFHVLTDKEGTGGAATRFVFEMDPDNVVSNNEFSIVRDNWYDVVEAGTGSWMFRIQEGLGITRLEVGTIKLATGNLVLGTSAGDTVIDDEILRPTTTNVTDLGTSGVKFKDGYFNGTVTIGGGTISGSGNMVLGFSGGDIVTNVTNVRPFSDAVSSLGADALRYVNEWLSGYLDITEMSDPAAPSSNHGRLYMKDNGSGKTQLVVRFPTGAVQVIATEP